MNPNLLIVQQALQDIDGYLLSGSGVPSRDAISKARQAVRTASQALWQEMHEVGHEV